MNRTKLSPPCGHFVITILEQEEGKRGIPLYQTWHIVNSITLYHITSHSIMLYQMVSHPHTKLHHLISHPILLCSILSYPIQSYQTTYRHHHQILVITTDLNYWIKHPFEFSDPILKPEYL